MLGYFGPETPDAPVAAHPGQGTQVPVWILGSSLFGAQVAAAYGLPYGFASHFAPQALDDALAAGYKAGFICSSTFNAGQTLEEIRQNELSGIYPDYQRSFDKLPDAMIDPVRKLVSVTYSNTMPPRMAAWRPGFGCTQLPVGAEEGALNFLPRFAAWPDFTGEDRGSAIGSNVKVQLRIEEAERLEAPVSFAFDERSYGNGTRTSAVVVV